MNFTKLNDYFSDGNESIQLNSTGKCPAGSYLDRAGVRATLITCYVVVFTCCVLGNVVTLVVISCQRTMRSSTNFFLANLAVADLMVGIFCVAQNFSHIILLDGWPLGGTMCRLYVFMLYLVPSVSAGILVLLSIERYIAVLHPMMAKHVLSNRVLGGLTAAVWIIAIIANIPHYLTAVYFEDPVYSYCGKDLDLINLRDLYTVNFALWYCLPLLTLGVLYLRIGILLWKSASGFIIRSRACSRSDRTSSGKLKSSNPGGESPFRKPPTKNGIPAKNRVQYWDQQRNGLSQTGLNKEEFPLSTMGSRDRGSTVENSQSDHKQSEPRQSILSRLMNRLRPRSEEPPRGRAESFTNCGNEVAESRKKVVRLLAAVIVAFAALTLPNHARLLWIAWSTNLDLCPSSPVMLIQPVCFLLLFANSGINPILYAFLSERFRQAVRDSVQCRNQALLRRQRYLSHISENPQN